MLAAWSANYVGECLNVLSAPGSGLLFRMEGRGGPVTLSAENYAFDWRVLGLAARDVALQSEKTGQVATAQLVTVSLPDLLGGPNRLLKAKVRGLAATLDRDPEGRFGFLDLLPLEEEEPSKQPYQVDIEDATIRLVDRSKDRLWTETFQLPWAKVDGAGPRWRAEGLVRQGDGGSAVLVARNRQEDQFSLSGRLERFELSRWLPSVKRTEAAQKWAALQRFSAQDLRATGTLLLRLPHEGRIQFEATVDAEGKGVTFENANVAEARLQAKVDSNGMVGWLLVEDMGSWARFGGRLHWEPQMYAFGHLETEIRSPQALPVDYRRQLPPELNFRNGRYQGFLGYGREEGLSLQGTVAAERAAWLQHVVELPRGMIRADENLVAVREFRGRYRDVAVSGAGDLRRDTEAVSGFAETERLRIERFRKETGVDALSGEVQLSVHAQGTLKSPNVELRAKGRAAYAMEPGRPRELGPFHAQATLEGEVLRLTKVALSGPAGVATASGTFNTSTQRLDLEAIATGVDLHRLRDDLQGTAAGRFRITGTPREFVARGPAEVYGLYIADQSVPLASAELEITRNRLVAREIHASRGAARVEGAAYWTFDSGSLSGEFHADSVQLHDFMEEGFEGSLSLSGGQIGGTIKEPALSASFAGKDLVLRGVRVDLASGGLRVAGTTVALNNGRLGADEGTLELEASYDWQARRGTATGRASDLPIERIQPLLPPATGIEGRVQGTFAAELAEAKLISFEADGGVEALAVNKTILGNGFYTLNGAGSVWNGTFEVGQPNRFIQAPEFRYDQSTDTLDAELIVYGLPLRDAYLASRPYFTPEPGRPAPRVELSQEVRTTLDRVEGTLDLGVHITGPVSNPNLDIESLVLRETKLDGESTGRLDAKATRVDERWQIETLKWTGGPGTLDVKGALTESGPIALDGNLYNFDTQWLSRFLPGLSKVSGDATLFFTVSGQTKDPVVEASLSGSLFEAGIAQDQRDRDRELKLEIYPILISDGQISVTGLFNYRGFQGDLKGAIPFEYPFTFPENKEVSISLHVENRPLDMFKAMFPELSLEKTEGTVGADLTISGPPKALDVQGEIQLQAATLGFDEADTLLRDVRASTTFAGGRLKLSAGAVSDKGGRMTAEATVRLATIDELLKLSPDQLLANRIEGRLNFEHFRVDEKDLPLDPEHESLLSTAFAIHGGIRIAGPLREPTISTFTPLAFENVRGDIPSLVVGMAGGGEPLIDPRFNVLYVIGTRQNPAQIEAAASVLNMYGNGSLKGRLQDMEAEADLRVRSGHLRLPNARIQVQEGGTVRLHWDNGEFDSDLRLDVNIEGRTALSTVRFGTTIERYDVFLELRGNLLDPEEQMITARSDPPDLSQERILNLLGQIDLVQTLSSQITGTQERRQLEQALSAIAIPVFFDPITEELAKQLGLEYMSLEYGPLGQTNVIAAKWLGKGFSIQGRREISEPLDGVPDYDLRLTYRPPRRIRQLRGLTFSLGIDQDRPWKLSVEYGQRFSGIGGSHPPQTIFIGEPPAKP